MWFLILITDFFSFRIVFIFIAVGYYMPAKFHRLKTGFMFDTLWGWFLISLCGCLSEKGYWKYLSSISFGFIVAFFIFQPIMWLNIWWTCFNAFSLSYLTLKLLANLKLNLLPLICLSIPLYFSWMILWYYQKIHQDRFLAWLIVH